MTHLAISYQEVLFYVGPHGHWKWLLALGAGSVLLFLFAYFVFDRLRASADGSPCGPSNLRRADAASVRGRYPTQRGATATLADEVSNRDRSALGPPAPTSRRPCRPVSTALSCGRAAGGRGVDRRDEGRATGAENVSSIA